jgi:hypothetical protein
MWKKQEIFYTAAAIIVTLIGWGTLRFLFPSLDYFPPERLIHNLERSWFVAVGLRKLTMVVYATLALVLMALFFKSVQDRWPGRGSMKGLAFGTSLGIVWAFGFFIGWAFLGTTIRAEFLNSVVDLIGLAFFGWLIGFTIGRDVPKSEQALKKSWLAVLLVALGFVSAHTLGANLLAGSFGSTADLLFVPVTLKQYALLFGLGIWIGWMFVMLRSGLPFDKTWAKTAFFAFGVFGHCWTWFHLFLPVIEFAGVLHAGLLVGFIGAIGVFVGALAYEISTATKRQANRPIPAVTSLIAPELGG